MGMLCWGAACCAPASVCKRAFDRRAQSLLAAFGPFTDHECLVLRDDCEDAFVALRPDPRSTPAGTSLQFVLIDACAGKQHFKRHFKRFGNGFHDLERWIGLAGQKVEQEGGRDAGELGEPASAQLAVFERIAQVGNEDVVVHDCRPF